MKIERITENKIRIILKQEDLKDPSMDLHTIMTKAAESHGLFLEILDKAKKEFGFDTDGRKLLIEAFSSQDEVMIFTITRYDIKEPDFSNFNPKSHKKCLKARRKIDTNPVSNFSIYRFDNFEEYCTFCTSLKAHSEMSIRALAHSSLYAYDNNYYLVLSNTNLKHHSLLLFYHLLSEFSVFCTHSSEFENRLKEYGKCIMKKNALSTTLKFFE